MTSFRLDSYRKGELVSSEIVDGLDNDELAVKLVLAGCTTGYCKLYRDDHIIAEMDGGIWSLPTLASSANFCLSRTPSESQPAPALGDSHSVERSRQFEAFCDNLLAHDVPLMFHWSHGSTHPRGSQTGH